MEPEVKRSEHSKRLMYQDFLRLVEKYRLDDSPANLSSVAQKLTDICDILLRPEVEHGA